MFTFLCSESIVNGNAGYIDFVKVESGCKRQQEVRGGVAGGLKCILEQDNELNLYLVV